MELPVIVGQVMESVMNYHHEQPLEAEREVVAQVVDPLALNALQD